MIARLGAIGDTIITTHLISILHELGHEVFYLTSETGDILLRENPKVTKIINHKRDSVPSDKLGEYFEALKQQHECDYVIDLCESIEVNLALYPADPRYKYPKYERKAFCNKNYYNETLRIAKKQCDLLKDVDENAVYIPELFFSFDEEKAMRKTIADFKGQYTILIGLSGSSRQKTYPYITEYIMQMTKEFPGVQFITVGDESCQILEYSIAQMENVLCTSGIWDIRQSILAAKYVDLVVSPDTGLLHGAGCFDTPKIALLTNTTHENISKHFKNIYPLEAESVACSPCFYLIYDADAQCNIDNKVGRACSCMSKGIPLDRLIEQTAEIYYNSPKKPVLEVVTHV